jgi:D-alanyl-D-alanine-carboxypeptidase/D-alanyl-D-alanine-endopeptidase
MVECRSHRRRPKRTDLGLCLAHGTANLEHRFHGGCERRFLISEECRQERQHVIGGGGLAWHILGESAWHSGGTGGFRSFVAYDPKERTGVVVLSNAFTLAGVDDIGAHIWNPKVPLANPEPPKQRTGIHIDPKILDNYTGRYQLTDRILEITRDGGRLFGQAGIGGPKFEMFAESEKNFFVKETGSQFTFETGPDGQATSLVHHRVGREPMLAARLS